MSDVSVEIIPEGQGGFAAHGILRPVGGQGSVGDYWALMKPRVMSLVIFTAFVGMMVAPGTIHPVLGFVAILAIAVGAGASGALNMWYDADIDARMQRTAKRPVPRGRITAGEALGFGATLSVGSVVVMGVTINWAAAAILAGSIAFYLFIYTMWLKRSTPQNIVIGGAAGAFPPMIGWAAVTGSVDLASISLFLIIFMWTPPHFWALALYKCRDYERVGVPMLPVVAGEDETRKQIWIYSLLLMPVTIAPFALGSAGYAYLSAAVVLGGYFLALAWQVYRVRDGVATDRAPRKLFAYSIFYLFALFAVLLIEQGIAPMVADAARSAGWL
ncbi:MAG: heme o synthase [Hyphomicrobiales bacterium]